MVFWEVESLRPYLLYDFNPLYTYKLFSFFFFQSRNNPLTSCSILVKSSFIKLMLLFLPWVLDFKSLSNSPSSAFRYGC